MIQNEIIIPEKLIKSVHINGMHGRVLHVPQASSEKRKSDILLLYGHHSSIERMYSIAQNLAPYGTVTLPDLPGFGGMDSFYKIGHKPTIDAMADYMATFVKLHYKKRPFTICAISYGFLVATRMMQKYPDIAKQITLVVSIVGFSHTSDFTMKRSTKRFLSLVAWLCSHRFFSTFARYIAFSRPTVTMFYTLASKKHAKMKDADKAELKKRIRFEVYLWNCNDVRTWFATTHSFLNVNLLNPPIYKPLHHVHVEDDQYLDHDTVVKHLKQLYASVKVHTAHLPNHMPTVVSDISIAGKIFPQSLRNVLKKHSQNN